MISDAINKVDKYPDTLDNIDLVVVILITVTAYVTRLSTDIASLSIFWAVTGYMTSFAAVVTRLVGPTLGVITTALRTIPRNVSWLVTVVTGWLIWALQTSASNVSSAIASVASVSLLLAVSGKVAKSITLVAFLTHAARVPVTAIAVPATSHTSASLGAFSGKVSYAIAFVACTFHLGPHFLL